MLKTAPPISLHEIATIVKSLTATEIQIYIYIANLQVFLCIQSNTAFFLLLLFSLRQYGP